MQSSTQFYLQQHLEFARSGSDVVHRVPYVLYGVSFGLHHKCPAGQMHVYRCVCFSSLTLTLLRIVQYKQTLLENGAGNLPVHIEGADTMRRVHL